MKNSEMTRKVLVIDDKDLKERRWDMLHNFEHKQKKLFLKRLTTNESLKMFKNLYLFAQKISDRTYYNL